MQTEVLKNKLERFLQGKATPAEVKQIDAWLSSGNYPKLHLTDKERKDLHDFILYDVQCYTAYPLFYPKKTGYLKKATSLTKKILWVAVAIVFIYFFVFYNW
ncbi:MAG TPA: hypothetical protein VF144_16590 [Chitinophagaceae bacterium]